MKLDKQLTLFYLCGATSSFTDKKRHKDLLIRYFRSLTSLIKIKDMPVALPLGIRQQIVEEKTKGKTLTEIAREKKLSYSTVCNIWRLQQKGVSLIPNYEACGPKERQYSKLVYRTSIWLKRLHPDWGAAFIKLKLQERYEQASFPRDRTMQRWFKQAGLSKVRSKIPKGTGKWAKQVHETWQIDAKEQFTLLDGQKACYLTIVDEKSGSVLAAKAFPPLPN